MGQGQIRADQTQPLIGVHEQLADAPPQRCAKPFGLFLVLCVVPGGKDQVETGRRFGRYGQEQDHPQRIVHCKCRHLPDNAAQERSGAIRVLGPVFCDARQQVTGFRQTYGKVRKRTGKLQIFQMSDKTEGPGIRKIGSRQRHLRPRTQLAQNLSANADL